MSYADEAARSGENYAACPVCPALPHEPCIEYVVVNAITGATGTRPRGYSHRQRLILGGIKPWGFEL